MKYFMKNSKPVIEDGVVAGNVYDKFKTRNPVARYLMKRFIGTLLYLVKLTDVKEIHEVGCGEGNLSLFLVEKNYRIRVSDFSPKIIEKAKKHGKTRNLPVQFLVRSIYDLDLKKDAAELIICCEVLEHLESPEKALSILAGLTKSYCLISVPCEPLWRVLNVARGKYIRELGNTPGHIQHWSKREFIRLVSTYFSVVKVCSPMPWTMVLCQKKR